jgi:hypothetical protein
MRQLQFAFEVRFLTWSSHSVQKLNCCEGTKNSTCFQLIPVYWLSVLSQKSANHERLYCPDFSYSACTSVRCLGRRKMRVRRRTASSNGHLSGCR